MTESRVALLSSLSCLALVGWLVVRAESATPTALPIAPRSDQAAEGQLQERIQQLAARIDMLQHTIGQLTSPRTAASATATTAGDAAFTALQHEVEALRLSIQELTALPAGGGTGEVGHGLAEIRREFPNANWPACAALLQRVLAEPGAAEHAHLDSDKSPALGELCMQRPRDVLLQLGPPNRTEIENGRFRWTYASPEVDEEGKPRQHLWVTFEKGYVWYVRSDVSPP